MKKVGLNERVEQANLPSEFTKKDKGVPGMEKIPNKTGALLILGLSLLLARTLRAQDQQKPQEITDAPSVAQPPLPEPPSPRPGAEQGNQANASDTADNSSKTPSQEPPHSAPDVPGQSGDQTTPP